MLLFLKTLLVQFIPGQALSVQLVVVVVDPLQEAPPLAGAGLLHDLVLDFVPLAQVTEQDPQFPQFPQLPLTEMYYNILTVQSSLVNVNQGRTQTLVTYKVVAMTTNTVVAVVLW